MPTILNSEKETIAFGKKLAAKLHGGDILCLYGDLGAGKTTMVKGIAVGLGVKKEITSPTFALMNLYKILSLRGAKQVYPCESRGGNPTEKKIFSLIRGIAAPPSGARNDTLWRLVHIDTYRLKDAQELIDIGAEDYLGQPDTICIIEWPEKIEKLLKGKKIISAFIKHIKKNKREIKII